VGPRPLPHEPRDAERSHGLHPRALTIPAAVEVRALTKRFGDDVVAVDDLDFTVPVGEVCGLLGPNGAGKTTTVRMLLGLVGPTGGTAHIFGEEVHPGHPVLERVGALVERPAFVPHLSGLENLRLWWRSGPRGPSGRPSWPPPDLTSALAFAGLADAVHRRVRTYSQGMRQRLALAQALLGRPELLLLDEPSNGLDPQEIRLIRGLLRELSGRGATVLLSSHLLSEVEQVCSSVVVMDKGRLVATGTVAELVGAAGSVYLEVDDVQVARRVLRAVPGVLRVADEHPGLSVEVRDVPRRALVAALVAAGVGVETVTARHQLEDVFLGLTGSGSR
jgi:ABC-2 type transport system ATP-binding protein